MTEAWDWAPAIRQWEDFAKRDPFQDFRPRFTVNFSNKTEPVELKEPIKFFHYKEQDMTDLKPSDLRHHSVWGADRLDAAARLIANGTSSREIPKAVQGNLYNFSDKNLEVPWQAHVGGLNISHKSDANRHIELALEHLVAAQTIPRLVKAWEKSEAQLAEHIKAREVECEAAIKAREAENYRFKRREELVKEFTGSPSGAWEYASDLAQTAIDRVITWEINDGATR